MAAFDDHAQAKGWRYAGGLRDRGPDGHNTLRAKTDRNRAGGRIIGDPRDAQPPDQTETTMSTTTEKMKQNVEATTDAVRSTVTAVTDKAMDTAKSLGAEVSHIGAEVSSRASDAAAAMRDGAVDRLDETRDALSESGDRLAETLNRAAADPKAGAMQSRVLSATANGLSTVSDALRERSVSDMAADLKALARRHPGAFAAGAAVAGFALARFLRSSARNRAALEADARDMQQRRSQGFES
jgi:ElaB/YqjD/DUF883 family membrane-anchored ribosome-binding protein